MNEDMTTTHMNNTNSKNVQMMDEMESFISEESKYKKKNIKQKVVKNNDITESDISDEEKKFGHLKAETQLRIGAPSHG